MKKYRDNPWIDPRIKIRASELDGNGMFASGPIKKDEVVVVWGGKFFVDKREAEKTKDADKKIQQIDDDVFEIFTQEEAEADPAYFMNHSCDPNVWMKDEVTLVARRDISVGEELTADYAMWESKEEFVYSWRCACGSPQCRKTITGKDWRLPELQKRYKGHFAPMINRSRSYAVEDSVADSPTGSSYSLSTCCIDTPSKTSEPTKGR